MKYVVIKGLTGVEIPIIFSELGIHRDIAKDHNVISAGFLKILNGRVECFGQSISLNKHSRPKEDAKLIEKMLEVG